MHDAILGAMEKSIGVELAMKSANASSTHSCSSVMFQPGQGGFAEGLHITACSILNSHTNLNKNDESRVDNTDEVNDLSVSERKFDRETHARLFLVFSNYFVKRSDKKFFEG